MPLVSLFDRNVSNSSSFRQANEQPSHLAFPKGNIAAKENGCESSFVKHHYHPQHVIDRTTLTDFSNNSNSSSMSAATASRSPFHHHVVVPEESYCAPWDLKSQEEKLKILSEQRSAPALSTSNSSNRTTLADALLHPSDTNPRSSSSSINQSAFHRTRSARTTSFNKKSFAVREPSPPLLPPLPPGGLIPPAATTTTSTTTNNSITCQCGSNSITRMRTIPNSSPNEHVDPSSLKKISYCLNAHVVRSGTDTSRSFVFSSSSPSNERSQRINTAPAKVDLSSNNDQHLDSNPITSQSSTTSLLSTTSSSSIESPLIMDETKPMSFEAALQRFKRLNSSTRCNTNNNNNNHLSASSLPKTQITPSQESSIAYERPWDTLQTSLINSLSSPGTSNNHRNLDTMTQKISSSDEIKQPCPPPFPLVSPNLSTCRQGTCSPEERSSSGSNHNTGEFLKVNRSFAPVVPDLDATIPIDRYFWYHYAMSRRTAENILQTRSPGSFLVRQSESGNQNDYSLSIRTTKSCMHMRICYTGGLYILGECSRPFGSVSRMIEYFSHTSVPIRGAAPIKLGTPVFRCDVTLSSSSPNPTHHHFNDGNDELL